MKIVHISHLYHPSQGGVQHFFKNISERLVKTYGDDVTIVTTDSMFGPERKIYKKAGPREETINGVKVVRFSYSKWHIKPYSFLAKVCKRLSISIPENIRLKAYGPNSSGMKRYLMNAEVDAFCGSSSNYLFMQLPLWRKANFFYYGSIHFPEDSNKKALAVKQVESINASTLYLANTPFEIDRLINAGVKREKIFVLGTGVDMKPFLTVTGNDISTFKQELEISENASIIGYIGRIEITKNVLLAVKAFEKIASDYTDAYLLLAGSGNDYIEVVKQYCNKLPEHINNRIKWQLNFSSEKKAVIFNSIDMLVLPSNNESFGLVFLEAWSCKKPVIGSSIGAVRNVIDDGIDGLLMNINDEDSLAEKISILLKDTSLRETMGKNGFQKVKENYTWDIIVSRLRECYINAGIPAKKTRHLSNV